MNGILYSHNSNKCYDNTESLAFIIMAQLGGPGVTVLVDKADASIYGTAICSHYE